MGKLALDLSGADVSGFPTLPAGTYDAIIDEVTMEETQGGPEAKLPAGTPMMNVHFKITEDIDVESHDGKVFNAEGKDVWHRYIIPPDKIDGKKYEHKAKMEGILVRFLEAIGYSSEELGSGSFDLDTDDLPGRTCRVVVSRREYQDQWTNDVKGVKPAAVESGLI
jgi:hypothetical protein